MANTGKPHIGFFGRRNNGKSSLINRLTQQDTAIVSDFAGTTTDPVKKSIEIPGIGPSIIIDTAGIDDEGDLGKKRIEKSLKTLAIIDLAIIVIAQNIWGEYEDYLAQKLAETETPFIIVSNKSDLSRISSELQNLIEAKLNVPVIEFSCINNENTELLKNTIVRYIPESAYKSNSLLGGLINAGDLVLLVTPIDIEAPEGRLILPQVQAIRDILDNDCIAIIAKEREIDSVMERISPKPSLVVTDSQVFYKVAGSVPDNIPLTSFSIVLARLKGPFDEYIKGTEHISKLKDGDKILLLESCTHHVSCDDIGRTKIPRWISEYTGKKLNFEVISGLDQINVNDNISLVIQCGGCVITKKQIENRIRPFIKKKIPVTNYGMVIAFLQGIYSRAVKPFINTNPENYL